MADQAGLTDFEEGARRALEWLGQSDDGAELAQIVGEMPQKLGDMEMAFLIAIGRAALAGHKAAPQTEAEVKARAEAAFWRRYDAHKRPAWIDALGALNAGATLVHGANELGCRHRPGDDWS